MKKFPQTLKKKIEKHNFSVQGKSVYKKILSGDKEEISLDNKIENNIFVHVDSCAQLNLSGSVEDAVFVLEKNAVVNYLCKEKNKSKVQKKISVIVGAGAKFNLTSSVLDNVGSNCKMIFILDGVNAVVNIEEAISAVSFAETDHDILISHFFHDTESNYFARVMVDDSAKVGIKVKTIIAKKASKSIAHQHIDNLIISDNAVVKGWPQLEINNDDVVCTHALTSGHLNEEEVFYANSRGIGKKGALGMIAEGFLQPIESKFADVKNEII